MWAYLIVGLVALQRLAELVYAERNTRALRRRGGIEIGRSHYKLIVLLHLAWLIAILAAAPRDTVPDWTLLAVFVALQALRVWTVASLGPYWTTRIITLEEAPVVRRGPYRFVRHPNYLIVAGEIAVLPLVFAELRIAVVFSLLNAGVLAWRIRQEDRALAPRRVLPDGDDGGLPAAKG